MFYIIEKTNSDNWMLHAECKNKAEAREAFERDGTRESRMIATADTIDNLGEPGWEKNVRLRKGAF